MTPPRLRLRPLERATARRAHRAPGAGLARRLVQRRASIGSAALLALAAVAVSALGAPIALGQPGAAARAWRAPGEEPRADAEDLRALALWLERYEREGAAWLAESRRELRACVARLEASELAETRPARLEGLLALAAAATAEERAAGVDAAPELGDASPALGRAAPELGDASPELVGATPELLGAATRELRGLARGALARLYAAEPGALDWVLARLFSESERAPRVAALGSLEGCRASAALAALFALGRDADRAVRDAADRSLAGWPSDSVHVYLARQLARWAEDPAWIDPLPVVAHFERAALGAESRARTELARFFALGVAARDWRASARCLELVPALADDLAIPGLIDALATWTERRGTPEASRRIEGDIAAELERRTGRRIGRHADRWQLYWESGPSAAPANAALQTSAGFFGLRFESDRVVFVLDRSGSMAAALHPESASQPREPRHSRWDEAVEQCLGALRGLGPGARFDLVIFNARASTWSGELQPADEAHLARARSWLRGQRPKGGTALEPAVREALQIRPDGSPDLSALEADTIVVLCDGQTNEGPAWVAPLLERVAPARIVVHCVQLASHGDGTLERLAELSGGQHRRVD